MVNGKIAVVFGGVSNECEISVITGTMAANVLKSGGADVLPIYISQRGEFFCGKNLADIAVFKEGQELRAPHCIVADGGVYVLNKRGKVKSFVGFMPLSIAATAVLARVAALQGCSPARAYPWRAAYSKVPPS